MHLETPQNAFVFVAIIFGIAFLIITPPFQAPDEYAHFYKALHISQGHILPETCGNKTGGFLPASAELTATAVSSGLPHNADRKQNLSNILTLLSLPLENEKKTFIDFSDVAVVTYSPVPYLPQTAGITAGKLLNASPLVLMYLGRLSSLLAWVCLVFLAIKITPVFKWVFFLAALMPMTLFEAASLSADGVTIGLAFLVIALFLHFAYSPEKTRIANKDSLLIFGLIFLLSMSKQGYFLLMFLFFLIPQSKFKSRRGYFMIFSIIFLILLIISSAWNLAVKNFYHPIHNAGVSPDAQIAFLVNHPFRIFRLIWKTICMSWYDLLNSFVGNFGWLDTPLPQWPVYSYALMLMGVSLTDKNDSVFIGWKNRILCLGVFSLISTLIFVLIYITWSPAGLKYIEGMQGRYFIPIAPLLFLPFYNRKSGLDLNRKYYPVIILFAMLILPAALYEIVRRYYY